MFATRQEEFTCTGVVRDLRSYGADCPLIMYVEYEVDGVSYMLKETVKLKSTVIKLGPIPIGQRKVPQISAKRGEIVTVVYDPAKPSHAHVKGNEGFMNI